MADTDSAVAEATPDVVSESDGGSEMGAGLFEDLSRPTSKKADTSEGTTEARSSDTRHSKKAEAAPFDPSKIDLLRAKDEDIPEDHRPYVERYKSLAKNMQSGYSKQITDLQRQLQELQQGRNNANIGEQVSKAVRDGLSTANQQDEFANLTPEQRQAIDTVNTLIDRKVQQFNGLNDQIAQMQQQLQQFQQMQQMEQQNKLRAEINEARELYGDMVDERAQEVAALMRVANPRTGQRYTVREAYELVAGVLAQKAQDMASAQHGVRTTSKATVAPTRATPALDGANGTMSRDDALAALRNLGFQ